MDQRVQWSADRREDRPSPARLGYLRRLPWLSVVTLLSGAAIATAAPLSALDDRARAWVLVQSAPPALSEVPSEAVIVVEASAADLEADRCGRVLRDALTRGHARGAWLLPPTDALCSPGAAPGVTVVHRAMLRVGADGDVEGLVAPSPTFGLPAARWVVPARAVPTIALGDLRAGKLPASVLDRRVVVFGMRDELGGAPATRVASMLGGLLAGGARGEAPRWLSGVLAAVVVGLVLLARRFGARWAALSATTLLAAVVTGQLLAVRLGLGLLPPASLLLGVVASAAVSAVRAALRWRSALRAARGTAAETRELALPHAADLRVPLEQLATEAYPAELVLVGELPLGEWSLDLPDPRVAEEGRDVRRPPYATRDGVPVTQVSRTFLESGEPTVIVPMVALGALEGYLFLCGARAEQVHLEDPDRATRLADELALILRGRRAVRAQEAPPEPTELAPLAMFLHDAPTPLLYADALGSVRLLSRPFATRLRALGGDAKEGPVEPGVLTLTEVLGRLTGLGRDEVTAAVMAALTRAEGASFLIDLDGAAHALSLRAVRRRWRGNSWSTGFAVALVEAPAHATGKDDRGQDPTRVTMVSGAAPRRTALTRGALRPPRIPSFSVDEAPAPLAPEAGWADGAEPWPVAPRGLEGRAGASCAVISTPPDAAATRAITGGDGAVSGLKPRAIGRGEAAKEG